MKSTKILLFAFIQFAIVRNCFSQSNILIFGGNGFIGSETVNQLLGKNNNITIVNRGSEYYDYRSRIKPHVVHIECDRYHSLSNCIRLKHLTEKYDFIIDFSAYHPMVLEDALDYLKGKFHIYIYISTDSVYEVCLPSKNGFSKESDAIRYSPGPEQEDANNKDSYGHYKLQGEEVLQREHSTSGLQFVILRLSDVIGPRDTTFRWWTYQTWFQFHNKIKQAVTIPKHVQSTSYVYVKDIAKVITKIVELISSGNLEIANEVYNLGFPRALSLRQMFDSMQQILGVQGIEYRYVDNAYYLYPSVLRGPMDISKASKMLEWKATPWLDAINETIQFYKQAFFKYPKERKKMLDKLKLLVAPEDFMLVSTEIEMMINDKTKRIPKKPQKDEL